MRTLHRAGQLIILAAGDESLYNDALPCFQKMGKKSFYLGDVGLCPLSGWILRALLVLWSMHLGEDNTLMHMHGSMHI